MRQLALIALVGAATALGACGDDDPATTGQDPGSGALVDYARSGGIAAMPIALTIDSDGRATLTQGAEDDRTSFTLDADEIEQLRGTLEAADLGAVETPTPPTACADCFIYDIAYGGEKLSYVEADEVPANVSAAVSALEEIATEHLPAELAPPKS